jgi:sugar diacid utilization regulator
VSSVRAGFDRDLAHLLLGTMRKWSGETEVSRLSTKAAAHALGVHVNTVYQRLRKFEAISNHGSQDLSALLDAITLLWLHRLSGKQEVPVPPTGDA